MKGPIALVLPALVEGSLAVSRGRNTFDHRRRTTLWWGLPWILLIAGPWFVWANIETDGKLSPVVLRIDRALSPWAPKQIEQALIGSQSFEAIVATATVSNS